MKKAISVSGSVKIQQLVPGGQGLGTLPDGKKVFFWNALPDETITEFIVNKTKSHYLEATATQISQPSPHRITPRDPCYLSTSPWQIMSFSQELTQKQLLVKESFQQAGLNFSVPIQACQTDQRDFFYRNKMEYALYYSHSQAKILPAFHIRGTHRKLPIQQSSIEHPAIFAHAQKIINQLNAQRAEARQYQSLLLRCDQKGTISGGLYLNHQAHPTFTPLTDQILGHSYSYSPNGFFQINLPVYEMALKTIQPYINTDQVLDLYAGVGSIGLSLITNQSLRLVESNPAAFAELQRNYQNWTTNSPNTRPPQPILAKSEDCLNFINSRQTVILDPPRAGCATQLLEKFLAVLPPTIIYLSCNPSTQARDLKILQNHYRISIIQPFNFFPRTPHIENLVVLMLK